MVHPICFDGHLDVGKNIPFTFFRSELVATTGVWWAALIVYPLLNDYRPWIFDIEIQAKHRCYLLRSLRFKKLIEAAAGVCLIVSWELIPPFMSRDGRTADFKKPRGLFWFAWCKEQPDRLLPWRAVLQGQIILWRRRSWDLNFKKGYAVSESISVCFLRTSWHNFVVLGSIYGSILLFPWRFESIRHKGLLYC